METLGLSPLDPCSPCCFSLILDAFPFFFGRLSSTLEPNPKSGIVSSPNIPSQLQSRLAEVTPRVTRNRLPLSFPSERSASASQAPWPVILSETFCPLQSSNPQVQPQECKYPPLTITARGRLTRLSVQALFSRPNKKSVAKSL